MGDERIRLGSGGGELLGLGLGLMLGLGYGLIKFIL